MRTTIRSVVLVSVCLTWSLAGIATGYAEEKADKAENAAPAHHSEVKGMPPKEAFGLLVEGNRRYVSSQATHDRQNEGTRKELTSGQKPHTIVLSCSDSRVPPELIFDQGLGQLFVVRTAGEVADSIAIASIEYAVAHLGTNLILVMGHESCGAVNAALTAKASTGSKHIDRLVSGIQPNIAQYRGQPLEKTLRGPVKAQVAGVTRDLMRQSRIVRERLQNGTLTIIPALYELGSGKVEFNTWEMDQIPVLPSAAAEKGEKAEKPEKAESHKAKDKEKEPKEKEREYKYERKTY